MKQATRVSLVFFLLFGMAAAEEPNCPATKAADNGQKAFQKFHEVIAPVWHESWQRKDYAALIAAGPKLDSAFVAINKLPVVFKTEVRAKRFAERRADFRRLVKEYSDACTVDDSSKVYQLLPELHEAFEQTATAILPIDYPEFDGFVVTLDLIKNKHIPDGNAEGAFGSAETLVAKMDQLNESTIPADLSEKKDAILGEFTLMRKIVDEIKSCCETKDMDDLKVQVNLLSKTTKQFKERFL